MATGIENLKIYQMAKSLEVKVSEVTKDFPKEERFASVPQLRRSSSSASNNIAEAYYRRSLREKQHIIRDIAIGEAEETRTNIMRSAEKGFIGVALAEDIESRYIELRKAMFGYLRFLDKEDGKRKSVNS